MSWETKRPSIARVPLAFAAAGILFLSLFDLSVATAQEKTPRDLAGSGLYRVLVKGKGPDGKRVTPRQGMAFAVAQDVLITARHVVGDARDWFNDSKAQSLAIPNRTVQISWLDSYEGGEKPKSYAELFVTPAPTDSIDASKLTVNGITAASLGLSGCEIGTGADAKYRALVLKDSKADSLAKPIFVPLVPEVYEPTIFGEFYVFNYEGTPPRPIQQTDSGSPILDGEGRVVGLVSGTDGGNRVLATLVPSFISLIPDDVEVDCRATYDHDAFEDLRKDITAISESVTDLTNRVSSLESTLVRIENLLFEDQEKSPEVLASRMDDVEGHITVLQQRFEWTGNVQWKAGVGILQLTYKKLLPSDKHVDKLTIEAVFKSAGSPDSKPTSLKESDFDLVQREDQTGIIESKRLIQRLQGMRKIMEQGPDGRMEIPHIDVTVIPTLEANEGEAAKTLDKVTLRLKYDTVEE